MDPKLILVRGLPGSGKSTIARSLAQQYKAAHFEMDMFLTDKDGVYTWVGSQIPHADVWCRESTRDALEQGRTVVVSNTFTRNFEMKAYFKMAEVLNIPVEVIEAKGAFQNIHNVPETVLEVMKARWEELDPVYGVQNA